MYCYEDKITDELIEVMASEEKICRLYRHTAAALLGQRAQRHEQTFDKQTASEDTHNTSERCDTGHPYQDDADNRIPGGNGGGLR